MDMEMLQIWYRSLRTRYGGLLKKKSGDGAAEFTERDEWILSKFSFLRAHIYEVKKRTTVSARSKDCMQNLTPPPQLTALQPPRSSPTTTWRAPTATATSERLINSDTNNEQQSDDSQEK